MLRIILVGYMGSGKTTVGKALAEALGLSFYDLDWCVESRYHRTVPQLFAERGEEGFRELERRLLHEVAEFEDIVLACGGGTPCFFDNMDFITSQAQTVYLKATPETLAMHLRMGKVERPLIKGKTPEQLTDYIRESLAQREPFYSRAHHTLCVDLLENFSKIKITVQLIRDLLKV
ncbi:MAG: shikimate kinase [Bacteroidaceae bacterium]|nr:shikimate kinase [Bacteroidaceae bacterium]